MQAKVYVTLRKEVLDPQGKTIHHALDSLGFKKVHDVRLGKYVELKLKDMTKEQAEQQLKEMCEKLLSNPVIEDYRFEIED